MDESLKSRLQVSATEYTVFKPDQVLTEKQLNGITEYLDDQNRKTRVGLFGVGIVNGLGVEIVNGLGVGIISKGFSLPNESLQITKQEMIGAVELSDNESRPITPRIVIRKGVGVTTDGDLIGLADDTNFAFWRPYDGGKPAYEPFQKCTVVELLPDSKHKDAEPLSTLEGWQKMTVVAFMESSRSDPAFCTGTSCDNRGITVLNTQRFLLVSGDIPLSSDQKKIDAIKASLKKVRASRPILNDSITTFADFARVYLRACTATHQRLCDVFRTAADLAEKGVLSSALDGKQFGYWYERLNSIGVDQSHLQYYHAFLKDIAETWNALRDILLCDEGITWLTANIFPKHLWLGIPGNPDSLRTGSYPVPWQYKHSPEREEAIFLADKISALIEAFQPTPHLLTVTRSQEVIPPSKVRIRIVPSRREFASLAERAIPSYYGPLPDLQRFWNWQRFQRGDETDNIGYHYWPEEEPFVFEIGQHDFFRIEGHIGMNLTDAEVAIKAQIRSSNLPIAVTSVLLHNRREKVLSVGFKQTPLHSLHYLLRQDIANQLRDNVVFAEELSDDVSKAGPFIQPSSEVLNDTPADRIDNMHKTLLRTTEKLLDTTGNAIALTESNHKAFMEADTGWKTQFDSAVSVAASAKASLGDVLRTDVSSPIDALSNTKSAIWVEWLDVMLEKRENDAKEARLFTKMISEHPGLEHHGGAVPGGTFVLAYNDDGVVVGDFTLPYRIDDVDESAWSEPVLEPPFYPVRERPIKVVQPTHTILDRYKDAVIAPLLKSQSDQIKLNQDLLIGVSSQFVDKDRIARELLVPVDTSDPSLDLLLNETVKRQQQVEDIRIQLTNPDLNPDVRAFFITQAELAQANLAEVTREVAEYFVLNPPDLVRNIGVAAQISRIINDSFVAVSNNTRISEGLRENISIIGESATPNSQVAGVFAAIADVSFRSSKKP